MRNQSDSDSDCKSSKSSTVFQFYQEIPDDCPVLLLACTSDNVFLLSTMGYLFSWGDMSYALGRTVRDPLAARSPALVQCLEDFIVSIACGSSHVLALNKEKKVFAWGENKYGQLGLGNTTSTSAPTQIISISEIEAISAGTDCSFAMKTRASYAWGNNRNMRLGLPRSDRNILLEPEEFTDHPWDASRLNAEMVDRKEEYVYIYSSTESQQTTIEGHSAEKVKNIRTENEDMKRRLENLENKLRKNENDLYETRTMKTRNWLQYDEKLERLKELVHFEQTDCREVELERQVQLEKLSKLGVKVKEHEANVEEIAEKEKKIINEIKELKKDIKLQTILDYPDTESETLNNFRNLLKNKQGKLEKYQHDTKRAPQETLLKEQEQRQKLIKGIEKCDKALKTSKEHLKLFETLLSSREQHRLMEYFEKHRLPVLEFINSFHNEFHKIHDTKCESLSTSIIRNSLFSYIKQSNKGLTEREEEFEVYSAQTENNYINNKFDEVRDILKENIRLTRTLNNLREGAVRKIGYQLPHLQMALSTEEDQHELSNAADNKAVRNLKSNNQKALIAAEIESTSKGY